MNQESSAIQYTIRQATLADVDDLLFFRKGMFNEMGHADDERMATMLSNCRAYFERTLPTGEFVGWIVEVDGRSVAGGGLVIRSAPPTFRSASGLEGYLMNVFTRTEWRRKGLGQALVERMLAYLRERGITYVSLRASDQGRPLYEKMGFHEGNEMGLIL